MERKHFRPFLWAAAALACLWALAAQPTAADRDFQLLALSLALAVSAVGAALGSTSAAMPVPGLLLLGWAAWSVVPLPLEWIKALFAPRAEAIEAARAVGAEPWSSLAADPAAALRGAVMLASLFALFSLARTASSGSRRAAVLTAVGLAGAGLVQAALGLEQFFAASASGEAEAIARGSFINRGQFAAFLLTALGVGVGLVASSGPQLRRRPELAVAALAAGLLLAAGLVTSMSRAALAAAGLVVLVSLAKAGRRTRLAGMALVAVLALGALGTGAGERVGRRFEQLVANSGDPGRLLVWRDSAPLAAQYAVWGAGPGGYAAVFERGSVYFPRKTVSHAHSDVLEAWIELGVVGFLLLFAGVGAVVWKVCRGRGDPLALGALAGAAGPLLQSVVDLPLQSPAVAASVACCLGLASGCCGAPPRRRLWPRLITPAAAAALLGALYLHGGPPSALEAFQSAEHAWAAGEVERARGLYVETLSAQPRATAVWLRLSEVARSQGDLDGALALARKARRWEPYTLRTEWALADLEIAKGETPDAVRRLAPLVSVIPDMRLAAIRTLWRAGLEPEHIEAALGSSDGRAAGDYLAFLARSGLNDELDQAYRRLVEERGLKPPQAAAAYIARFLNASRAE